MTDLTSFDPELEELCESLRALMFASPADHAFIHIWTLPLEVRHDVWSGSSSTVPLRAKAMVFRRPRYELICRLPRDTGPVNPLPVGVGAIGRVLFDCRQVLVVDHDAEFPSGKIPLWRYPLIGANKTRQLRPTEHENLRRRYTTALHFALNVEKMIRPVACLTVSARRPGVFTIDQIKEIRLAASMFEQTLAEKVLELIER